MGEIRIKRDVSEWDNRPAHQYINGEWIDIPTHKYTNGRWQGELTSRSPLKFRADGEMLDWRVEGKTSGNLVESFKKTEYTEQYKICLLGMVDIKPSTSYTISFIMEEGAKAYFSEYIFEFKNFTGTGQRQVFNIITKDNINKNASTWTDEYGWILCKNMVNNENPCNFRDVMILEGTYTSDTLPPYEPYGGVGDYDETEQKYRIPLTIEGENLFNPETAKPVYIDTRGNEHPSEKSLTSDYISVNANTTYTLGLTGSTDSTSATAYCFYNSNKEWISGSTYVPSSEGNIVNILTPNGCTYFRFTYNHLRELVEFVEGKYEKLPPYSTTTTLYTDHQLMDGDSIDFTTDQTTIPLATGNNTLTVDTAVKPKSVFVKFEG